MEANVAFDLELEVIEEVAQWYESLPGEQQVAVLGGGRRTSCASPTKTAGHICWSSGQKLSGSFVPTGSTGKTKWAGSGPKPSLSPRASHSLTRGYR